MADFKINNTRIPSGDIKTGSTSVSKIYRGYSEIWPEIAQSEVEINGLIWQTVNTSTLEKSGAGDIEIATSLQELADYLDDETPAACYWEFNNTNTWLLYNIYAAEVITPPTGFRLPTYNEWLGLKNASRVNGSTQNITKIGGGVPNFWRTGIHANTEYGANGFNASGGGFASSADFIDDNKTSWWDSDALTSLNPSTFLITDNSTQIIWSNSTLGDPEDKYIPIRFCKTA